ncbi:hypothetical protein DH09_00480 (plasmid) [Bacillaceae bacterium JMAK1]|nr:hypothetical protein DH09_00480 [Bacillaceae bacterium JMAK1]
MKKQSLTKTLSVAVLSTAFLMSTISGVEAKTFSDVREGHFAYDPIENMVELEVINGYTDGTFRPNQYISRAQVVNMLVRAFDLDTSDRPPLPEDTGVSESHMYYDALAAVYDEGWMHGGNYGMRPAETLTRGQMALILQRVLDLPPGMTEFGDVKRGHYAFDGVSAIVEAEIAKGYPKEDLFKPQNFTTRAQFAIMMNNVMDYLESIEDEDDQEPPTTDPEPEPPVEEPTPEPPEEPGDDENHYSNWPTYDKPFIDTPFYERDMDRATGLSTAAITERYKDWTVEDLHNEYGSTQLIFASSRSSGPEDTYSFYSGEQIRWDNFSEAIRNGIMVDTPFDYMEHIFENRNRIYFNDLQSTGEITLYHMGYEVFDDFLYEANKEHIIQDHPNSIDRVSGDDVIINIYDNFNFMLENKDGHRRVAMFDHMHLEVGNNVQAALKGLEWVNEWDQVLQRNNDFYVQYDYVVDTLDLKQEYATIEHNGLQYVSVSNLERGGEIDTKRTNERLDLIKS